MDKIVFDAKIQNLYSPDYEYLQNTIDTEIKKSFRQNIQNPFVSAIIKGFNLQASLTDPSKILVYHETGYGGVITSTGELIESSNNIDLVAPADSTPGVVNYVYIRIYSVYGTFNKKNEVIEEGVQKNIDLYNYTKTYDRLITKWEIKVYTQSQYLALTDAEKAELLGLGSFVANGTSPITEISIAGRVYTRSFIQQNSIKTGMISSTGFVITQHNVSTSEQTDDHYAGTPVYLQDDVNELRTLVREIKGTANYDDFIDNSLLTSDSSANRLHGNGVLADEWDELEVIPNSTGLAVVVKAGKAIVRGGVSHVLENETKLLILEPQVNYQVGDWATRTGEEHIVGHKPTSFSLAYQNVGNLKITDIYNEPYPDGFDEGIDYNVDYENGIVYIPLIGSRIAEERVKCYYQWGYTRYDLVEIGTGSDVKLKTGVAGPNAQPEKPDTNYLLLYQLKVDPFDRTIPLDHIVDTRVFSQYVRNLYEINSTAESKYNFTINKATFLTSSGEYDSLYAQWNITTYRDEDVAITSTGGTRILTAISCLPNDEVWLVVDKTPWTNTITVELNPVAGYQELGLEVTSTDTSGLYGYSDYYFKLNGTEYKTTTSNSVTYEAVAALMQSVLSGYQYNVSFIVNDIRVSDSYYIGTDSIINLNHCDTNSGDLFHNLTGFTAFELPFSNYQKLGLTTSTGAASGLEANTTYYFKVNSVEYRIQTAASLTINDITILINLAIADAGFSAEVDTDDIKISSETGAVALDFSNGDLFTHLTGFSDFEPSVDGVLAVDTYHDFDLSYKDRVEKFPILIEDKLSEGFHNIRLTVNSVNETFTFYSFLSGRCDILYDKGFLYSANETEPYKVTNYRGARSKFYVDPTNTRKALIYLDNKEICSSTGFYQNYWDVEQAYPVSRVDNQNIVTGGTLAITDYILPTVDDTMTYTLGSTTVTCNSTSVISLQNYDRLFATTCVPLGAYVTGITDLTHFEMSAPATESGSNIVTTIEHFTNTVMIFFTPTTTLPASENHQRAGVYLTYLGTGGEGYPWDQLSIRIHDAYNNQVGDIAYKNYSSSIVGWNYFEIPATLIAGNQYHYHVLVHGRDGSNPTIRTATGNTTSRCYVEMYKPYTGMYKDSDVINIINSAGSSIVAIRTSTEDSENSRHDQSTLDIMGVDFSDNTIWANWSYETYIGIDVKTGRVKFPTGYDANNYWIEFNAKQRTSDFDAKTIMRHGDTETVEDTFRRLTHEAYTITMRSDGTLSEGALVRIHPSTGLASSITDYSQWQSFIGICHRIPTVNKLGYPNPVEIAVRGITVLATSVALISGSPIVGDEIYITAGGLADNATTISIGLGKRVGVIMQIIDTTHVRLFIT
jgi:hypothetical protein